MAFFLVDDVVIADYLITFLLFGDAVASASDTVSDQRESNADETVLNEIHFRDFHIFIVDNFIVLSWVKIPWNKSVRDVTQQTTVPESFLVKEAPLLSEDVREQEFGTDLIFNRTWD